MTRLLIVDDERNVLYSLKKALRQDSLEILTAETGREAIRQAESSRPSAVILDIRLPDMSGLDVFTQLRHLDSRLPVIMITAYSTTETAIEAMKRGAYEYLLKPVDVDLLCETVDRALEVSRMAHVPTMFEETIEESPCDLIVGRSTAMQEVYKAIGRIAHEDVTVLIQGESGTGKELVARSIYHHSRRSDGPFQAINCAAIPESLLESELFGHERAAFTGAETQRIGKFEQSNGGTLLLDEIGDMSSASQAKVLRLLQDGTFQRVGGNETLKADVRVIASTNRDLEALVENAEFRQDLYYRLKVFCIDLPPLRKRKDDLPLLVEHFVKALNTQFDTKVRAVSDEAMRVLEEHPWPGNVRELQSALKFAMVHAVGETITPASLPASCHAARSVPRQNGVGTGEVLDVAALAHTALARQDDDIYWQIHSKVDRILLREILDYCEGNQVVASRLLGISRSTLRARISDLGLQFKKRVCPGPRPSDEAKDR